MKMGFALVLFYLMMSVLAPLILTGLILRAQGLSRVTGELISLTWWMFVVVWWSMIAGPSDKTPRNVQVFTFFYILFLGIFFLGVWVSLTDLFEHLGSGWIPKGRKSITVVGSLLIAGFFFTRRLSASSVVVLLVGILILVLLNVRSHWQSQIVMAGLTAFLLVYITAVLTAGLAHEIQPAREVLAHEDEVFFFAPFRSLGWIYFFAFLIVIVAVIIGVITKNVWIGIATLFVLYLIFALVAFIVYFVNTLAIFTPLINAVPGWNVSQWIADIGDLLQWPDETIQVLKDLTNPTLQVEGEVALETDEGGYFQWPWEGVF